MLTIKNKYNKKLIFSILSLISTSTMAAQDSGYYVSIGYGVASMNVSTLNNDFGQVGTSIQQTSTSQLVTGKFGLNYGEGLWGTELGYNYMFNASGGNYSFNTDTSAQLIDLDQLLYFRPQSFPFFGYLKAGVSYGFLSQSVGVNGQITSSSPSGFTLNGGLGAGVGITRNTQLKAEWTNYGWLFPIQTNYSNINGSWSSNTYTINLTLTF